MKAVAPNCTILVATAFFIIMHVRLNKQKQNPPFSLKNVLDAAIKFINFIKSQPLNTHFLIFCLTKCYISKYKFELQAESAMFFKEHHFY